MGVQLQDTITKLGAGVGTALSVQAFAGDQVQIIATPFGVNVNAQVLGVMDVDTVQERWHRRIAPERGTAGRRARNRSIAAGPASEPRSRMTGSREGCKTLPAAEGSLRECAVTETALPRSSAAELTTLRRDPASW
jgi:hypothetical protein